jgi:hypothetical protein
MQSVIVNFKKNHSNLNNCAIKKKEEVNPKKETNTLPLKMMPDTKPKFKFRTLKRQKELKRDNNILKVNNDFKNLMENSMKNIQEKSLRKSSLIHDQLFQQKMSINEKLNKRRERSITLGKNKSSSIRSTLFLKSEILDSKEYSRISSIEKRDSKLEKSIFIEDETIHNFS